MTMPIDRRKFLTAMGVGAAVVVVSCSSDDAEPASDGASGGASDSTTTTTNATVDIPTAGIFDDPFTYGVSSGDPTADSAILWTRLGVITTAIVPLKWEVASDEAFTSIVGQGLVDARPEWGHSVHLDATGLDPFTEYFFRFSVDAFVSPVGRTKTTPANDATLDELRFAFASCQNYAHGYFTAHDSIAADRLDAVFFLGDFIYESAGSPDSFRPFVGDEPMDLEGYRARYALYLADTQLQASRASAPWIVTWDDHEVENNAAGNVSQDGVTGAEFEARRFAAYQAFYENHPLRLDPPETLPWEIYRTVRYGSLANFIVLDGRQYRDDQPCGDKILVSATGCADFANDRTMLGAEQESWLGEQLGASEARWTVLAQQTVMAGLVIGDLVLNVDQWDGYPAARERLFESIAASGADDVIVLTGDIHSAGAATLFRGPADARVPVAAEFVGTSISSNSLVDKVPGGADLVANVQFEGIQYLNVKDHGYCRCTVTDTTWTTEFVVVDTSVPSAPAHVDATATVTAGSHDVVMS